MSAILLVMLLLARVIGQYRFARWRLSSVVVCNAARWRAGRPAAWRVGGCWTADSVHGGPVRLRPVRATPCRYSQYNTVGLNKKTERKYQKTLYKTGYRRRHSAERRYQWRT